MIPYGWEANASWYNHSQHDAMFVIAYPTSVVTAAIAERIFGPPAAIGHVGHQVILVYNKNLLTGLPPIHPRGSELVIGYYLAAVY
jgi:hypothetical protein